MHTFMIVAAGLLGTTTVAAANPHGVQHDGLQIEDARTCGVLAAVALPSGEVLGPDADAGSALRLRIAKKAREQISVEKEKLDMKLKELQEAQRTRSGTSSPPVQTQGQPGGMRRK